MKFYFFLIFIVLIGLTGCGEKVDLEEHPLPPATKKPVSYQADIRPIIETKCVACHSCFDAPCQLKLESDRGLVRGATEKGAYGGSRLKAIKPTRLGIDAETEEGWRQYGFYSVLAPDEQGKALLQKMVALGKRYQFEANQKLPSQLDISIRRENICPTNVTFSDYQSHHQLAGMPFAVTGLTDEEYALVAGWLEQGALVDAKTTVLPDDDKAAITEWENYLNQTDPKRQLVARWLYEHLYLAHLYFTDEGSETRYYELIRSYTPPGKAIEIVKTRLPNNAVDGEVYYRLRAVDGIIVHKRHITLRFDQALREEIEGLFFSRPWQLTELPGYSYEERANPFLTYQAIPSSARYQFMLNHAEYFVRTFIRGPVCRGQIATDVIRDQFWVMFQDPDDDVFITDKAYAYAVTPFLGLPGQDDRLLEMGENWESYKHKRNQYLKQRNEAYAQRPELASLDAIWDGDGKNTNALLTVFRHFDSASVRRGFIGNVPETLWWMDYPLFERTYYELVVNFDVFGNLSHQLQTRLYFDLIRNGAEHNFLRLIPAEKRKQLLASWYQGLASLKTDITYAPLDTETKTMVKYRSDDVKYELAGQLLQRFFKVNAMRFDPVNRCQQRNCARQEQPRWIQQSDRILHRLTTLNFKTHQGLLSLPELTLLSVSNSDGERTVYSLLRNRYHQNVAFLFGESLRYKPGRDTLTVYPGIAGSYPNFIFDVPASELELFQRQLTDVMNKKDFDALVARWGIRRTHPEFWQIVHDFTAWQQQHEPLEAGIFDVNRYENL